MLMAATPNRRILLIDDMPTIHQDFRKILAPATLVNNRLSALETEIFGDALARCQWHTRTNASWSALHSPARLCSKTRG